MFKKIFSLSVMAIAILFTSCEKENINSDPNNGGSSSGGWWVGTAPFSMEFDGTLYKVDSPEYRHMVGYHNIFVTLDAQDKRNFTISIPENAVPGLVYSMPSPANISYIDYNTVSSYMAANGGCKVTINNATTIEGYFYSDLRLLYGPQTGANEIRKGYFKVNKK